MTTGILLVGMAGLCLAGLGWLRWRGPAGLSQSDAIRLITSRYLGGKRFLTLVEVDGERLLIGVAGEQVSLVARLGAARPIGAGEPA